MNTVMKQKQRFLTALKTEKNRSPKTIENYNRYLDTFFTSAQIRAVSHLTVDRVESFKTEWTKSVTNQNTMTVKPRSLRTLNYHLTALRMFLAFLKTNGVVSLSPQAVRLVQTNQQNSEIISSSTCKKLCHSTATKTIEGKRDRAIFELLFSTGLRVSELCSALLTDFDAHAQTLTVSRLRGGSRVLPLPPSAVTSLLTYCTARTDDEPWLFIRYGRKAHDGKTRQLHPRAVQRLFFVASIRAGLERSVTPQSFRRRYAVSLLGDESDRVMVQNLLGYTKQTSLKSFSDRVTKHKEKASG